ncbi:adenylate cyclase [Kappamyces sp. JEL0829]|nr:adenylate cyclase [Kappamyces sp. JEL0829]
MTEAVAVQRFRDYLRIRTVQPTPAYQACTQFLTGYAKELGLDVDVTRMVEGKDIVVLTWLGTAPGEKSIILNSHTDVVPVTEDKWTYPPFEAHKDEKGDIYARGSQDMKCVGIWYLEAIRLLKARGIRLKRTLHLTFVPDEEIGGKDGMEKWCESEHFRRLNAGFALDEGLANEEDAFKVYYGERAPWWIWIKAVGGAGHGSKFIEPSATIRLLRVLDHFVQFREAEKQRMETGKTADGRAFRLGDVTTCNITMLKAGSQLNVVHELAEAGVDMRVCPTEDFDAMRAKIASWVASEPGVEYSFLQSFPGAPPTNLATSKEWTVLTQVAAKHSVNLDPEIFPAATDSRFLRLKGLPAFGISAIKNTPVLLHDHNEFLNEQTLLDGIPFYADLIQGIADL